VAENADVALEHIGNAENGMAYPVLLVDDRAEGAVTLPEKLGQNASQDRPLVIGLTSLPAMAAHPPSSDSGFDRLVTRPVKAKRLLAAITAPRTDQERSAPAPPAPPDPAQVSAEKPATPPADETAVHILLAEDNLVNQKIAVRLLRKAGYGCDVVENGRQVLEQLAAATYDLVLMDCQMPEMDGYEATRKVREQERLGEHPRIPIVALTANAMEGDRERCLEAGMDDYLSKPIDAKSLQETIHRWTTGIAASGD
jgi:CheY-like chemotaxis protein